SESGTDVGALFEKLRSEQVDPTAETPVAAPEGAAEPGPVVEASAKPEPEPEPEAAPESEPEPEFGDTDPATARRDEALAEAAEDLMRRGKRALQDEQNDLLDGLRRQRGKIDTTKVLPSLEDQVARWAHVIQPAVDTAYSSGAGTVE